MIGDGLGAAGPPPSLRIAATQVLVSLWKDAQTAAFHLGVNAIVGSDFVPRVARIVLLRAIGMRIGRAQIYPGVSFRTKRIQVGSDAMVNSGTRFDNDADVTLGDRVRIGPEVLFCTSTHTIHQDPIMRAGLRVNQPITVEDGAWVGARAVCCLARWWVRAL